MTNLTLSIDPEVLRQARIRAATEATSVNQQVRQFMESYAAGDATLVEQRRQAAQDFVDLSHTTHSGSGPSGRTWTRDDLYEH
jgi:plasmid stability protein